MSSFHVVCVSLYIKLLSNTGRQSWHEELMKCKLFCFQSDLRDQKAKPFFIRWIHLLSTLAMGDQFPGKTGSWTILNRRIILRGKEDQRKKSVRVVMQIGMQLFQLMHFQTLLSITIYLSLWCFFEEGWDVAVPKNECRIKGKRRKLRKSYKIKRLGF